MAYESPAAIIVDGNGSDSLASVDSLGQIKVVPGPAVPPPGSTPVSRISSGELTGATSTDNEDVYTITNGRTLTIQLFQGGAETSEGGGRVELIYRPTGLPASDILISLGYCEGNNFQFNLLEEFIGDGTAQIVLIRHKNSGGVLHITGRWSGFEEVI